MRFRSLILMAATVALVTGCGKGSNPGAVLPGDGTYTSNLPGMTDPYASPSPGAGVVGALPDANATDEAPVAGYTLMGIVSDSSGQPLAGARVSIGAQTAVADAQGAFSIVGIRDSEVMVDVVKEGFRPITGHKVSFDASRPTADKEFRLAAGASTPTTPDGSATDAEAGLAFHWDASFSGKDFKSVSGVASDGNLVYVLGVVDGFLFFDRMSVVAIDPDSGEALATFRKTGWFSGLPKAADTIVMEGNNVVVSDGATNWTFSPDGSLLTKKAGSRPSVASAPRDAARNLTYRLVGGNQVEVKGASSTETYPLGGEVTTGTALALDGQGRLLVLDSAKKAVHRFRFK